MFTFTDAQLKYLTQFINDNTGLLDTDNFFELFEKWRDIVDASSASIWDGNVLKTRHLEILLRDAGVDFLSNMDRLIYGMYNCDETLTEITLPDNIKEIGSYCFTNCPNLKKIEILSNYLDFCGAAALAHTAISELIIPSCSRIPPNLCLDCMNLEKVVIKDGAERLTDSCFKGCEKLKDIYLPKTITYIHDFAFLHSDNIETITFGGTYEEFKSSVIYPYFLKTLLPHNDKEQIKVICSDLTKVFKKGEVLYF